jgi:hypothetical protein
MPISNFPRLRFTDIYETEVLDRTAGFYVATDPVDAEDETTTRTSMVSMHGVKQLDIFIDISNNPGAGTEKLFVKVRFSGKEEPLLADKRDWGYIQIDNLSANHGISEVKDYMVEIDLTKVNNTNNSDERRYLVRIDQISGAWASAIVWTDTVGVTGKVYFQRQGGGM